jgi:hypothetical protein
MQRFFRIKDKHGDCLYCLSPTEGLSEFLARLSLHLGFGLIQKFGQNHHLTFAAKIPLINSLYDTRQLRF